MTKSDTLKILKSLNEKYTERVLQFWKNRDETVDYLYDYYYLPV